MLHQHSAELAILVAYRKSTTLLFEVVGSDQCTDVAWYGSEETG
jgi:hypothetical protein